MVDFQEESAKYVGVYRAIVLDTDDPLKLGRIKVNVLGIYKDIATVNLPWAVPLLPVGFGSGAGYGAFTVPEVSSMVFVMFESSDIYQPIYIGSAPDAVHGLPVERLVNYPHRSIMKTPNGIVIYVDDSSKEIKVDHPSGAYISIDNSGNIIISGTKVYLNP